MYYLPVQTTVELDNLLGKESQYEDFVYRYDTETIELLKKNFSMADSLYLWAMNNGTFVGFVSCGRDWWEADCFFSRELFVDPTFQGQGVGKALLSHCIDHACTNGAQTLVTQTAFENIPMRRLCQRFGFEKWKNPQWDQGITYKLPLDKF